MIFIFRSKSFIYNFRRGARVRKRRGAGWLPQEGDGKFEKNVDLRD
ncbi:MAG: hypothetical protein PHF18_16125 [Methanosarcina sp.]|nr:hypothetical protein [Methanosarcina sp.]MDD3248357.1 hypothetical protein [Methanosarcina sp.]MDD4249016.1 hypothetical protein [Methanosarcina sp.]